jgi:hypothetical protein
MTEDEVRDMRHNAEKKIIEAHELTMQVILNGSDHYRSEYLENLHDIAKQLFILSKKIFG